MRSWSKKQMQQVGTQFYRGAAINCVSKKGCTKNTFNFGSPNRGAAPLGLKGLTKGSRHLCNE